MEAIRAPKVIGEILGGMLFGGTFLYHFFPGAMEGIFQAYPEEGKVLNLVYQFGLIFLMFCGRIGSFTFALSLKGHKVEPPVKLPEEKRLDKMTTLSAAPLFAEAMTRVFTNGSISVLFD